MSHSEEIKAVRELTDEGLSQKIKEVTEELFRLRFRKASGQLERSHQLGELRRARARVKTVQGERARKAQGEIVG